jgi:trimethylamine--corrinoid protein Co-methyltransferase
MIDFLRCQSFEKLVIDAELIGMARRLLAGVQARDHPIALELMRKSAHKSNFLSQSHTHRMFRKELYIPSDVVDRGSLDAWKKGGSLSTPARASARIEQLLKTYQPNPLSPELRQELKAIAQRAAQQHGMSALPPLPD